jgi:hypothetical protein
VLAGIPIVLLFLALVVVVHAAKKPTLVVGSLNPTFHVVPEGVTLLTPGARLMVEELEDEGWKLVAVVTGTPRKAGEQGPPLKLLALSALLLSPDGLTEASVTSMSVVYEKGRARSASSNDFCALSSHAADGHFCKTSSFQGASYLGKHPNNSWRRIPGATVRDLLAAHEEHVRAFGLARVPLPEADYQRRASVRNCEEFWYLEGRGLVRFEGTIVRETRLLRLRSILRVVGPGMNERRRARALALVAVVGGAGAAVAYGLARPGGPPIEYAGPGLFLLIGAISLALFSRSAFATPLWLCMPAALVFGLSGVREPVPGVAWGAVFLFAIFGQALVLQPLRVRREKRKQEELLASLRERASPVGPSA